MRARVSRASSAVSCRNAASRRRHHPQLHMVVVILAEEHRPADGQEITRVMPAISTLSTGPQVVSSGKVRMPAKKSVYHCRKPCCFSAIWMSGLFVAK